MISAFRLISCSVLGQEAFSSIPLRATSFKAAAMEARASGSSLVIENTRVILPSPLLGGTFLSHQSIPGFVRPTAFTTPSGKCFTQLQGWVHLKFPARG